MKIDLGRIWEWIKENALPVSMVANVVLVVLVVVVLKGSVSYANGVLEIKLALTPQDHVKALFKDDETRLQALSLLRAHGYYEISKTSEETEAVTRALRQLDAGHNLVSELRELSHKNKPPFEPRDLKVTLMLSDSQQIARGEAMICEHDAERLQSKFIEFFTHDEKDGIYVVATKIRRCPELRNIVAVNPADWSTLQLSGTVATDANARVYLHRPYERKAVDPSVGARSDARL